MRLWFLFKSLGKSSFFKHTNFFFVPVTRCPSHRYPWVGKKFVCSCRAPNPAHPQIPSQAINSGTQRSRHCCDVGLRCRLFRLYAGPDGQNSIPCKLTAGFGNRILSQNGLSQNGLCQNGVGYYPDDAPKVLPISIVITIDGAVPQATYFLFKPGSEFDGGMEAANSKRARTKKQTKSPMATF